MDTEMRSIEWCGSDMSEESVTSDGHSEQRIAETSGRFAGATNRSEGAGGPGEDEASDDSDEFGGARSAGNWGAGGPGDRTGVG